jgi:hypothetical protein
LDQLFALAQSAPNLQQQAVRPASGLRLHRAGRRRGPARRAELGLDTIETDNLPAVFADVNARLKDGRTVISDKVFDFKTYASTTMVPITKRVTSDEIMGNTVAEVYVIANGK